MADNHQIRNIKFIKAVNEYLYDIRKETTLEKRIERLKKLKQEVGDIFTNEFIHINFERIKRSLIQTQNFSVNVSDTIFERFFSAQKQKLLNYLG
jgi:hypothetical protein